MCLANVADTTTSATTTTTLTPVKVGDQTHYVNADGNIVDKDGNAVDLPALSGVDQSAKDRIGGLHGEYFGLESQDIKRAIGLYLASRLAGSNHAGAMQWAGKVVLQQAENRKIEAKQAEKDLQANTQKVREFFIQNQAAYDQSFINNTLALAQQDPDAAWNSIVQKRRKVSSGDAAAIVQAGNAATTGEPISCLPSKNLTRPLTIVVYKYTIRICL